MPRRWLPPAGVNTVLLGTLGPIGASAVVDRLRYPVVFSGALKVKIRNESVVNNKAVVSHPRGRFCHSRTSSRTASVTRLIKVGRDVDGVQFAQLALDLPHRANARSMGLSEKHCRAYLAI